MSTSSKRKTGKKSKLNQSAKTKTRSNAAKNGSGTHSTDELVQPNLFTAKRMPNDILGFFKGGSVAPWLWCLSDQYVNDSNRQLMVDCYKSATRQPVTTAQAEKLFQLGAAQIEHGEFNADDVLSTLAWVTWCVESRKSLPESHLHQASDLIIDFVSRLPDSDIVADPLANQVINCESILTLANLFKSHSPFQDLTKIAIEKWADAIDQLLDGDGWINARYWTLMRPLLACWTRCAALAKGLKLKLPKQRQLQLDWLIRQALRSTRKDGSQVLGTADKEFGLNRFWHTAIEQFADKEDRIAAASILQKPELISNSRKSDVPEFSGASEWAGTAVMRQSWENTASKIAVLFGERQIHIEIANKKPVVTDFQLPAVAFDNEILSVESEIEIACWHSDDDVDYLELEIELSSQVKLQRQILLAREDNFAFLADAIVSPQPGLIQYTAQYPLGNGLSIMPESETNELYLKDKSIRALVLPLSVPEWQIEKNRNTCHHDSNSWTIEQQVNDQYLYAPMFIDLDSRRAKKPRTWRHLTVDEKLQIVHNDSVRCYRVQLGKDQWVFYRSLARVASRTFLGQNVNCEFFAGRFDQYGETEELISIN